MQAPTCPVDGLTYTEHPPAQPPSSIYRQVREAFIRAMSQVIYMPGISESHRLAILRARDERRQAV